MPVTTGIVIAGAAWRLGMAIALKKAGFDDFVVLEKDDDLGGTWRDNQLSGLCMRRAVAPVLLLLRAQSVLDAIVRAAAGDLGLPADVRAEVRRGQAHQVRLRRCGRGLGRRSRRWRITPGTAITGPGPWCRPAARCTSRPIRISAGRRMACFSGPAFHSARWDHSVGLTGKQVAVIGTGASAIQFVPEMAARQARLMVFQRTAPWLHPRPDAEIPARLRGALEAAPLAGRAVRDAIYWGLETRALGFAVHPGLMAPLAALARRHLRHQVADPELRARLTPDYTIGCKRILLSSSYYPALQRPNVDLVTDRITEITQAGLVTADGTVHPADVIIYATGFKVTESVTALNVTGRDGRGLADEGLEAYHGITVPGFPNFFMVLGPNTGLGHSSVVFMIESQIQHIMSCLRMLARDKADTIEVSRGRAGPVQHRAAAAAAPGGVERGRLHQLVPRRGPGSTGRSGRDSPSSTGPGPAGPAAPPTR